MVLYRHLYRQYQALFLISDSTLFEQRRAFSEPAPRTFPNLLHLLPHFVFCHHYSRTLRLHRFQRTTREVTRIADSNLAIDDLTRSVRRISSLFRQTRYGKARHTRRRPALPSRSSNHRPARYHLSLQKRLSALVSSVFEDILARKIARLSRCIELFFYRRFLIDRTEASTISLFHTSWQEAL